YLVGRDVPVPAGESCGRVSERSRGVRSRRALQEMCSPRRTALPRLAHEDVRILVDARLRALGGLALRLDLQLARSLPLPPGPYPDGLVDKATAVLPNEAGRRETAWLDGIEAQGSHTGRETGLVHAELHAEGAGVVACPVLVAAGVTVRTGHRRGCRERTAGVEHDIAIALRLTPSGHRRPGPC